MTAISSPEKLTYRFFPFYDSLRVPTRHWLLFDFATAILFAFGVEALISKEKTTRAFKTLVAIGLLSVGIVGTMLLLFKKAYLEYPLHYPAFSQTEIKVIADAFSLSNPVFYIPMFFVAAYLIWIVLLRLFPKFEKIHWAALALLVIGEAYSFGAFCDNRWPSQNEITAYLQSPIMSFLREHREERVAYLGKFQWPYYSIWPLYTIPEQIPTLNGYDPLIPRNLQNLLDLWYVGYSEAWNPLLANNAILSLLSTRYILVPSDNPSIMMTDLVSLKAAQAISLKTLNRFSEPLVLAASSGTAISVKKISVPLKTQHFYLLSLTAKADKTPDSKLIFDLYAPHGYDAPLDLERQMWISPRSLKPEAQEFFKIIYTRNPITSACAARIYTFSKLPITVTHAEVVELENYGPPKIPAYRELFHSTNLAVYENLNRLPRLFSVNQLELADNLTEIKKKLYLRLIDPEKVALLYPNDFHRLEGESLSPGLVSIKEYDTDALSAETTFNKNGFVVLSDQYYPGWKAYVDGRETAIYEVDGLLRGVEVPPGKHRLLFEYRPMSLYLAFALSGATALLLAVLLIRARLLSRRTQ